MNLKKLPKKLLLKGGTILDPLSGRSKKGNVEIEQNKIKSISSAVSAKGENMIDCSGLVITHGFCDLHVHFREPGREDKETLQTGSRAALAGGFTRVCIMPNTSPPLDSPESIRFIVEKAEECPVHIHPIGAVTKGQKGQELTEVQGIISEGAVALSDDGLPISDAQVMRLALEYTSMFDKPVINHAEDECLRNNGLMNEGEISTRLGLAGNPSLAEAIMIQRDLELANMIQAKLHVPHVTSASGSANIRRMKKSNQNITAEVTPHHLFFNEKALLEYNTNFKVAPPIRTENDRKELIKAVKDGTIDCIATDHAPHTIEEKEATFEIAPFGMIGLESCFGAANKVLDMPLKELLKLLTVNPRRIMGFDNDLFTIGCPAELTIFDPDQEWIFKENNIYSKSRNTPFFGEKLKGKIHFTISKGFIADLK
ncbi:MAG: dihydroorotase [Candidatus Neomarinimicrobiota bacterium]|jgi:dihydroorotase|nr:dihydroorotase [Candidatus Neomarinimicrobiota bacterium]